MMDWLADNALVIWIGGAVALTFAVVVFLQTRSGEALAAIAAVLVITATLLAVEHIVETPREAVERTLYELADTVEANDVPGALQFVAPGASQIRKDIETIMPLVSIEKANIVGTPQIEIDYSGVTPAAKVECRGFVHGTFKQNGMKGGDYAKVIIFFIPVGDRWLVSEYEPETDWRKEMPR